MVQKHKQGRASKTQFYTSGFCDPHGPLLKQVNFPRRVWLERIHLVRGPEKPQRGAVSGGSDRRGEKHKALTQCEQHMEKECVLYSSVSPPPWVSSCCASHIIPVREQGRGSKVSSGPSSGTATLISFLTLHVRSMLVCFLFAGCTRMLFVVWIYRLLPFGL